MGTRPRIDIGIDLGLISWIDLIIDTEINVLNDALDRCFKFLLGYQKAGVNGNSFLIYDLSIVSIYILFFCGIALSLF